MSGAWYVETTVRNEDCAVTRQWINVVPIVEPILASMGIAMASATIPGMYPTGLPGPPKPGLLTPVASEPATGDPVKSLTLDWTSEARYDGRRQTIRAIQAVRSMTGLSLGDAKRIVDMFPQRLKVNTQQLGFGTSLAELTAAGVKWELGE